MISLEISPLLYFGQGLSSFMHIIRPYTTTVSSFIRSSLKEELCFLINTRFMDMEIPKYTATPL